LTDPAAERIDLTAEDEQRFDGEEGRPPLAQKLVQERHEAPREQKKLEEQREEIRGQLARGLILLLTFTLIAIFVLASFRINTDALTQTIFPSVATLVGSALGFYFGAEFRGGLRGFRGGTPRRGTRSNNP
jgi:hypothetical protein